MRKSENRGQTSENSGLISEEKAWITDYEWWKLEIRAPGSEYIGI